MARIDIKSAGATLSDGVLQLENGVAMDTTLRNVADQNNTTSPLKLSTTAVQVVSPLRITTDDPSDFYLDCEDGSTNNRFSITRNTASQQVNLNFSSNPAGSTTTVGAIRTFTDGVNLGEVVKFREDGQVTFTERVNVEADSLVTTQSSSVIAASTTNANLVIAPSGTGALVADIPDGTTAGGNARGVNAVDLQISRANANEVASGQQSVIVGGYNNRASGIFSMAGGGQNIATNQYALCLGGGFNTSSGGFSTVTGGSGNTASSNFATVSGGESNTASSGSWSTVGGGSTNTASSSYSTVSGGQSNTASTNTHATVVGGNSNTSSGSYSVSGGSNNVASGNRSTAFGNTNTVSGQESLASGLQNNVSGTRSFATGYSNTLSGGHSIAVGWSNTVSGFYSGIIGIDSSVSGTSSFATGEQVSAGGNKSFAQGSYSQTGTANSSSFGNGSYTSLTNQQALGNFITYKGDCQTSRVVYSIATGNVASGGSYTFTGTELIVPKNGTYGSGVTQAYLCTAKFIYSTRNKVGTVNTINTKDCFTAIYNFAAKSTSNVGSLIGTPTLQSSFSDPNLASTVVSITIGASGEILFIFTPPTWTGGGTIEFRGTLHLEFTEIGVYQ